MIRKIALVCIINCIFYMQAKSQGDQFNKICNRFDSLNTAVRDCKIKKAEAKAQFQDLIIKLRKQCGGIHDDAQWTFPLAGYNYHAIGGVHGNGYNDKGYTYFDGNKHAAHPAHDIFITDRNQDALDDKTQKAVSVLAVANGVVIACCDEWDKTSNLRGGRYIWIYHPEQNILSYYAHNNHIFVKPGQVVRKGAQIAEVGRTGYNAYKKRSPTHLHFSVYRLVNNLPVAYNGYKELVKSATH